MKTLLVALWQRHPTSEPFLLQKMAPAQKGRLSWYQVKIVECFREEQLSCLQEQRNKQNP